MASASAGPAASTPTAPPCASRRSMRRLAGYCKGLAWQHRSGYGPPHCKCDREKPPRCPFRPKCSLRRRRHGGGHVRHRKVDRKRAPLAAHAVHVDDPAEVADDAVHERQPEPRATAHFLGREERLENARERRLV